MKQNMEARSYQSLPDAGVFSPSSIEHQDVFMYDDERRELGSSDSPTYLDISVSKNNNFPLVKNEPDSLTSWTQKHPEHWSQNEILDWIYFVAGTLDVDHSTIRGEGFQNITGPELCRMTLDDFQTRDPMNGKCFYEMFKSMHKDSDFIQPQGFESMSAPDQCCYTLKTVKSEPLDYPQPDLASNLLDSVIVSGKEMQVRLGEYWYPIDCEEDKYFCDAVTVQYPPFEGYGSSDSESMSDTSEVDSSMFDCHRFVNRSGSTGSDVMSDDDLPTVVPSHMDGQRPLKRKPATQRKKAVSDPDKQQNRGRKPGQISKGNHLWEFIRDLLKDPQFNPHLLRWEEKETGVFRFVQSEAVAQMWGRKKNNPGMTYEKLSRAMRFCRSAGYFAEVPKTGKFPKKLCFRFGEKASGWED